MAIRTMLEALLKIPVNITAETVSKYKGWVETPFANFMMLSQELGNIMEYLAKGGQFEAALIVLDVLLEPISTKDRLDETKLIASTPSDFYWLNQAIQTNLPVVTENDPIGVVSVAEKQLSKAIELEYDPKTDDNAKRKKSYWRLSINPRSDENYERDLKNLLVDTIIIALDKACEQKRDQASQIIAQYIDGEYSIFRRIGIYMLCTWGMQYPDLLERAYIGYRKEPIIAGQSEFHQFLEIQFNNLPANAKKEIIKERENPDPQWVDNLLEQHPESFDGETIEEKKQTLIEKRQWVDLTPIASYLQGEDKEHYENLLKKYGQPPPSSEQGVVVSSWEGPESPIELNELAKKSVAEVIQFLLDYVPSEESTFGVPSREGLGRTLETDVQTSVTFAQSEGKTLNQI